MYSIIDHAQGLGFVLKATIARQPAVLAILVVNRATYLGGTTWTISPKQSDELSVALDAWIAGGCVASGLDEGVYNGLTIKHAETGYKVTGVPKSMVPAMKRINAYLHRDEWSVGASKADEFEKIVSKVSADKKAAVDEAWPIVPGVTVKVRPDGSIAVTSPYAPEIRDAIAAIPTARWDRTERVWTVMAKYRTALRKALTSIAEVAADAAGVNKVRLQRAMALRIVDWAEKDGVITIASKFDEEVNEACRKAGLRWDKQSRRYKGTIRHDARDTLVGELEELQNRPVVAPVAIADKQPAAPQAYPSVDLTWFPVPAGEEPAIGTELKAFGKPSVVTGHSRRYKADENIGSVGGMPWWEGESIVAVYVQALEQSEVTE